MADNTILNTGSGGDTIATDDIGGIKYPRTKLIVGIDGTNDGDVAATNPLPIEILVGTASIGTLAANSGVDIGDVDVTSLIPGVGATSLGKAEDAVHSTGDTGVMPLAVRNDVLAALAGTDGDYAPLQVDASGALYVNAGTVTAVTTVATVTNLAQMGGVAISLNTGVRDTGTQRVTIATDDVVPASQSGTWNVGTVTTVTTVGAVTEITNALPAGTNSIGVLGANAGVLIGNVNVESVIPGVAINSLGKAEDFQHNSGSVGVMALAVRQDTPANTSGNDNDYESLRISAGRLWCSSTVTTVPAPLSTTGGGTEAAALRVTIANDSTGTLTVDNAGTFAVQVDDVGSVVDANNSTTTPLGGGAAFTGTGVDLLGYSAVCVTIYADVDSATDGMTFQFSSDNTNWDDIYEFTMDVSSSDTRRFQFPVTARYFRIVYTNGGGAQSAYRCQTILHTANQLTSIHRLVTNMSPDRSAQVVKSVLFAQAAGSGDFVKVNATAGGNLKVALEEFGESLPAGTNAIGSVAVPAVATGGATPGKLISAASTNATSVKASAGTLYTLCAFNVNAAARYLKMYNKASAPTVGTDTPVFVFTIPGNTAGAGFVVPIPAQGIAFSTGIAFALTSGAADADTGAVSAAENVVSYAYN
jgi:hypothetical protein